MRCLGTRDLFFRRESEGPDVGSPPIRACPTKLSESRSHLKTPNGVFSQEHINPAPRVRDPTEREVSNRSAPGPFEEGLRARLRVGDREEHDFSAIPRRAILRASRHRRHLRATLWARREEPRSRPKTRHSAEGATTSAPALLMTVSETSAWGQGGRGGGKSSNITLCSLHLWRNTSRSHPNSLETSQPRPHLADVGQISATFEHICGQLRHRLTLTGVGRPTCGTISIPKTAPRSCWGVLTCMSRG